MTDVPVAHNDVGRPRRRSGSTLPSRVLPLGVLLLATLLPVGCGSTPDTTTTALQSRADTEQISRLPDGVYHGSHRVRPPFGTIVVYRRAEVAVELNDGRLQTIEILRPRRMRETLGAVTTEVIKQQSTDVDATSGATWSKIAVLRAVDAALIDTARGTDRERVQ